MPFSKPCSQEYYSSYSRSKRWNGVILDNFWFIRAVHARIHVQSHVRVSTHTQNPQHERKIAHDNVIINRAIAMPSRNFVGVTATLVTITFCFHNSALPEMRHLTCFSNKSSVFQKSQSSFPRQMAHRAAPIYVSIALGHASANAVKATARRG